MVIYELLKGRVGSHAYGLAHEGSDEDFLGIYAVPTEQFWTVQGAPKETLVTKDPDSTMHEAAKFCKLALNSNPTVLELLWLPEYTVYTQLGQQLIDLRHAFLFRRLIRDSYLGYADSQFKRMGRREAGEMPADTFKRVAKNARHMARLLIQAQQLEKTGELLILLDDPLLVWDLGQLAADGDDQPLRTLFDETHALFERSAHRSALPDKRDEHDIAALNYWLAEVRLKYLTAWTGSPSPSFPAA